MKTSRNVLTHPLLYRPHPPLNQPRPLLSQPRPLLSQPHPLLNQPLPLLNQQLPLLNQPRPLLNQPRPLLNQPLPLLSQPHPLLSLTDVTVSAPLIVLLSYFLTASFTFIGPPITLSLGINGTVYPNNSVFNVTAIGISDSEALIFKTSFSTCCREQRLGQCYYPDGTEVGIRSDYSEIFRNRGVQFIRLNRRVTDIRSGTVPFTPGVYQCCLPNACGDTTCLSFELLGKVVFIT